MSKNDRQLKATPDVPDFRDHIYEAALIQLKETIERAQDARNHTVGTYYRLKPEISHFHAALNEVGAGTDALTRFFKHFEKNKSERADSGISIHIAGHSTGAIVLAHMLNTMKNIEVKFSSCSLLAPACSIDLYQTNYLSVLFSRAEA